MLSSCRTLFSVLPFILFLKLSPLAEAMILPPNNLHIYDRTEAISNVSEEQFYQITDQIIEMWQPLAKQHGATIVVEKNWKDSTVNAYASQEKGGTVWRVAMFGGLARRPEVTPDGFALVVCHELGHHFAGYPFKGERWASSEGEADYFATQACARRVWGRAIQENYMHRYYVPPMVQKECDSQWGEPWQQDLCYRVSAAGYSLATLLARLGRNTDPRFETPDSRQVSRTDVNHPEGQCRLDTFYQGALCSRHFDHRIIPGKGHPEGQNSPAAERIAADTSCARWVGGEVGARPRCWFKPLLGDGFYSHWR